MPTRFVLTAYSNRIMVVVTQTKNMGTLLLAQNDNPTNPSNACYSWCFLALMTRLKRTQHANRAYQQARPDAGPLLLALKRGIAFNRDVQRYPARSGGTPCSEFGDFRKR